MTANTDEERLITAAMEVAAEGSWRRSTLSDIAERAGIETEVLVRCYRSKKELLVALALSIDAAVSTGADHHFADSGIPVRERLMEILLLRFEAMQPYKAGIVALLSSFSLDPPTAMFGLPTIVKSMRTSLVAVGVPVGGLCGILRIQGLVGVFLETLRVWASDDTIDLARTMHHLDKRLVQTEKLVQAIGLAGPTH